MVVIENGRSDETADTDPARVGEYITTAALIDWLDSYAHGGKPMGDPSYWLMATANRLKEYEALTLDRG